MKKMKGKENSRELLPTKPNGQTDVRPGGRHVFVRELSDAGSICFIPESWTVSNNKRAPRTCAGQEKLDVSHNNKTAGNPGQGSGPSRGLPAALQPWKVMATAVLWED